MPVPSGFFFQAAGHLPSSFPFPPVHIVLAYVGLGPGQEMIPYFFGLLGMIGTAVCAILQWPVVVLLRRRRTRGRTRASTDAPAPQPESVRKECGVYDVPPAAPASLRGA